MNRKTLSIALAAAMALPVLAAHEGSASADRRVRVHARAHVRIHAPARVRIRTRRRYRRRYRRHYRTYYRPRVHYRLHVGGDFYYGWRYAAPPPPCYYECGPRVRARYVEPPQRVAVVAHEPDSFSRFGIGLFAGGMNVEDREASSDIGVLGRFHLTRSLALEGEIAKSELNDGSRIDRRLGLALLWDLAPRSSFSPFLLVGGGAVRADIDQNGNSSSADQAYGEIGAGLGWRLSRHLELSADVRAGSRDTRQQDVIQAASSTGATSDPPVKDSESYTRARLSAILNF